MHYLTGGSGSPAGAGRSAAAQAHLSILVGLAVLVKGVGYWFDRYGLEISSTTLADSFTGINYTADHATVNAKLILSVIAGSARCCSSPTRCCTAGWCRPSG